MVMHCKACITAAAAAGREGETAWMQWAGMQGNGDMYHAGGLETTEAVAAGERDSDVLCCALGMGIRVRVGTQGVELVAGSEGARAGGGGGGLSTSLQKEQGEWVTRTELVPWKRQRLWQQVGEAGTCYIKCAGVQKDMGGRSRRKLVAGSSSGVGGGGWGGGVQAACRRCREGG